MSRREKGVVVAVQVDSDHGDPPVIYLSIEFSGFAQGFGGLYLDAATDADFKSQLCALFGAPALDAAVGSVCFGLWCIGENNEQMEGIENASGDRFTITGFRRKHWPGKTTSALDQRKASIASTIARAKRRQAEEEERLVSIEDDWVEWETAPRSVST